MYEVWLAYRSAEIPEDKRTLCSGLSTEHFSLLPGRRQRKSEGQRQASVLSLLVTGEQSGGRGCKRGSRACWLGTQALEPVFLGPNLTLSKLFKYPRPQVLHLQNENNDYSYSTVLLYNQRK